MSSTVLLAAKSKSIESEIVDNGSISVSYTPTSNGLLNEDTLVVLRSSASYSQPQQQQKQRQQRQRLLEEDRYYILIEFAVRHLDFQIAELVAVLNMHHIDVIVDMNYTTDADADADAAADFSNTVDSAKCSTTTTTKMGNKHHAARYCTLIPLPNDDIYPSQSYKSYANGATNATTTANQNATPSTRQQLQHHRADSTRPFAILSMDCNSPLVPHDAFYGTNNNECNTGSDCNIASIILSRCTLVRSVIELWGMATSIQECATLTQEQCCCVDSAAVCGGVSRIDIDVASDGNPKSSALSSLSSSKSVASAKIVNARHALYQNHSIASNSWKMTIHTLGSTYTREEQDTIRHTFTQLVPFHGVVQMNHPINEFIVIHEIELDRNGGPKLQHQQQHNSDVGNDRNSQNQIQYPSIGCYFGRVLSMDTGSAGGRNLHRMNGNISKYDLKQRKYLGPTSMDAELSFIMTNLGHVQKSHYVFDPFVGTGSILLSCATRGAHCIGTDIDIRVLRGRNNDSNIFTNFQQFHLPRPELIRSDNHIYHRHFHSSSSIYNAIVCDPPYGIRAGARKSGSKRDIVTDVTPENRHDHIAQTQSYPVSDVLADLVDVASRTLVMDGRLVYVIPSFATSFDVQVDLPQHPCLELVHVCYQPLSSELGRRIVAMKKVLDYDETKRDEYLAVVWKNGSESADKCANIRAKIIEMAKTKPRYVERAAIRKEKRRVHREEKKVAKKLAKT